MKIYYEEGPERVSMGAIQFTRGEAKEVEDGLAKQIIGKGTIKFKIINPPQSPFDKGGSEAGGLKTKGKGGDN